MHQDGPETLSHVRLSRFTHISPALGTSLPSTLLVSLFADFSVLAQPLERDPEKFASLLFGSDRVLHDRRRRGIGNHLVGSTAQTKMTDVSREGLDVIVDMGGI